MELLLGGSASPAGWAVQFLHAPFDAVVETACALGGGRWRRPRTRPAGAFPDGLRTLEPFEAPWTRELVWDCGEWTVYLNNFLHGGDPNANGPFIAARLGARCVTAQYTGLYGPGHHVARLEILVADPEQGLVSSRLLSAASLSGQWEWRELGRPQPFEDPSRYTAWRVRDRLDRGLLVRYLLAQGIHVDDELWYGRGVVLQHRDRSARVTRSRRDLLADFGLTAYS